MTEAVPPQPRRPALLIVSLLGWTGMFWLVLWLQPILPGWPETLGMFLAAAALVALSFAIITGWSRLGLHRTTFLALGVIGFALLIPVARPLAHRTATLDRTGGSLGQLLIYGCAMVLPSGSGHPVFIEARNHLYSHVTKELGEAAPEPTARIFALGLCQLLLAMGIGLWIGGGIDEAGHLIPVAIVATLADTWSVSAGATAIIIRSSTIHYFLLRFPMIGGGEGIPFLIGLSDFLFFGIFYHASVRFNLPVRQNVVLMGLAFLVAVTAALFFQMGLPVLPFMAVFFLMGNFRLLSLKKDDLRMIMLFMAVVTVVVVMITVAISFKP